eukprot:gi/632988141/ref/XP_007882943.1/ PREDICTED: polyadenylate-binding protein 1-like isoform X2 [Callorhinchus milii]
MLEQVGTTQSAGRSHPEMPAPGPNGNVAGNWEQREAARDQPPGNPGNIVFVKNLADGIDHKCLQKEFSPFGTILKSQVMTNGGQSKGFGFVWFLSPAEAMRAIKEMNGRMVCAKPLYVALAESQEERKVHLTQRNRKKMSIISAQESIKTALQQGKILFVMSLDDKIDDEHLRKEFSSFGTIARAKVMTVTGWCQRKTVGFVRFMSPESATEAMIKMNVCRAKRLHLVLAQDKEEHGVQPRGTDQRDGINTKSDNQCEESEAGPDILVCEDQNSVARTEAAGPCEHRPGEEANMEVCGHHTTFRERDLEVKSAFSQETELDDTGVGIRVPIGAGEGEWAEGEMKADEGENMCAENESEEEMETDED